MKRSVACWSFLLLLSAWAPLAEAQVEALTWEDPTLAGAVEDADLIVLARAVAVGRQGAAYQVERTLKGPTRDGAELAITGLHHPQRRERPPVKTGDVAYLILRGKPRGEGFSLPTPTFGRFPVRTLADGERRVVASLGGVETFVRIAVPPDRFEATLRGLVKKGAPELVKASLETLSSKRPGGEPLYLALNTLALFVREGDYTAALRPVLRLLDDERYQGRRMVRVRMAAARVLGRLGGSVAVRRLVRLVALDPQPAVQSVAAGMVARALEADRGSPLASAVAPRLASLASKLSCRPVSFGTAEDPRANRAESPLAACFRCLGRLGARVGVGPALAALERDDADAIEAGLAFFSALGDVEQVGAVARRMRPRESEDALVNRIFARTLEALTGKRLGEDREAWLGWWRERRRGGPKR